MLQEEAKAQPTSREILSKASRKAVSGGFAGFGSQAVNVLTLMWMRTITAYQYRYGGSFTEVTRKLWAEGGVPRFYRGLIPAMCLAPSLRFLDTAANDGALMAFEHTTFPLAVKTLAGSSIVASLRVFVMPLDAWETTKQVSGSDGLKKLMEKAKKHPMSLWRGSSATIAATWVGHYLWFFTNNKLSVVMPTFDFASGKHVRNATIGFASAAVSDTVCNSLRVLKTNRQTALHPLSYLDTAKYIVAKEGYRGLFGRGLATSVLTNGLQAALFNIGWKALAERLQA